MRSAASTARAACQANAQPRPVRRALRILAACACAWRASGARARGTGARASAGAGARARARARREASSATPGHPPLSPRGWVPCGLATHHISPHSRPHGIPPPAFTLRGPKYLVQVVSRTRKCICGKHLRNQSSVSKRRASVVVVDMWKPTTRIR